MIPTRAAKRRLISPSRRRFPKRVSKTAVMLSTDDPHYPRIPIPIWIRDMRNSSIQQTSGTRLVARPSRVKSRSFPHDLQMTATMSLETLSSVALLPGPDGVEHDAPIDPDRIALGIQQPWAELILRGIKTLEIRSQSDAATGPDLPLRVQACRHPCRQPPSAARRHGIEFDSLPLGLWSARSNLIDCRPCRRKDQQAACVPAQFLHGQFAWELSDPQPFDVPLAVRFLPYGVWFYPFKRRPPDWSGHANRECRTKANRPPAAPARICDCG